VSIHHVNGRPSLSSLSNRETPSRVRAVPAPQPNPCPRQKVNVRFFIGLIVGALLLAAVWYGVNRWQVRRHAANLLKQADLAEAQRRLDRAARYVGLYVGLVPSDNEARTRYGLLLERLADSPRGREGVLAVFEQVLIREPQRQDIRRRVAKLTVELGRFDDAVHHLTLLSADLPGDGEVEELFGRAYEGRGEYAKAAAHYQKAIDAVPERVAVYLRLARLERDRLGRAAEVEATLEKLVKANGQSYQAYLGRARYRLECTPSTEALEAARRDLDEALRLAPDEPEVLLRAADLAVRLPNGFEQARKHLRRALELHPQFIPGYEALAQVELAAGRPEEALTVFRRGLEKVPEQAELSWNLANVLIQRGQLEESEEILGRLEKLAVPRPRRDYLRAALKMQRGDWMAARNELEAVRPLVTDSRQLTIQCDLLLAECCERAGEHEMAILICRRAIALDSQQFGACLRLIKSLQRLGRIEEALGECQRMMAGAAPPPAGWPLLAQLLIAQNLRLPAGQQQWAEIDRVLDRAAEAMADAAEVALLQAETRLARQDSKGAYQTLERARAKQPRQEGLWLASVDLALRDGKPELVRRILTDAEKQLGDGASLRLLRLRVLLGSANLAKDLHVLEAGLDKFPDQDRSRVLAALADANLQAGRMADARRLWAEVARIRSRDLEAPLHCFDLALEDNDESAMNDALAAIRRLEGEGGTFGRYDEARRLIWRAARGDKSGLPAARAELEAVSKRRPGWSRVSLCLGQVWESEGHPERALEHYLHAIEQGERQLGLIRRVVSLLYDRGRFTEAEMVLQRLPEQMPLFGDMLRLAAEVSKHSGNPRYLAAYVLSLLRQGLTIEAEAWLADLEKAEPSSLRTALLKARLLKAQGKGREAGMLLKRHAQGQKDPQTLLYIAALMEDAGCGSDALALYRRYAEQVKAPEAILPLARSLGRHNQLGEALDLCERAWQTCPPRQVAAVSLDILQAGRADAGQMDRVERRLKEALQKDQSAGELLLMLGSLEELRGRYQEAETLYRKVLERDPRNAVALNNLAWIVALRDGNGAEALVRVNNAIEVLGPLPELLDTRAVAFLATGRTDLALADLQAALDRPNLDPKVRFSISIHLALANQQAGNSVLAKKVWRDCHTGGGRVEALHGLEQGRYERLSRELGQP
jgi:tetratricopeptide (TPR) repeat protein